MKVLILCTSPGLGGLELYAEREWRALQSASWTSHLVTVRGGRLAQRNAQEDERVLLLSRSDKHLPLFNAWKLARYIDRHEIDVLHMHWGRDLNLASLARRFSSRKPRLVYSRHMEITRSKKDPLHRFFYSQVDRMLVITRQLQAEARRYLPLAAEQIQVLYLGVEKPVGAEAECSRLPAHIMEKPFRIALFGRIEHTKGQHVLVEAMAQLASERPDMGALLIGQVMDADYFERLRESIADAGLEQTISRLDFIDNPMAVMACFDVIVLTTHGETFGLVLAEAMRSGVAVIGTNAGGVPEIIEDGQSGLLVPPGDSVALARAIIRLYDDPALKRALARAGKDRADRLFDSDAHFRQLQAQLQATVCSQA